MHYHEGLNNCGGYTVLITIREAVMEDTGTILHFVRELAIYEKAEHEVLATEDDVRNQLFGIDPVVFGLICEYNGEAIGFAVYFHNYSTWTGKLGLFLEDLYVAQQHRGVGAGKALLKRLARIAVDKNCSRFEWNVLDWNQPAIEFYESLNAKPQSEWIGYRLSGDALHALAKDT